MFFWFAFGAGFDRERLDDLGMPKEPCHGKWRETDNMLGMLYPIPSHVLPPDIHSSMPIFTSNNVKNVVDMDQTLLDFDAKMRRNSYGKEPAKMVNIADIRNWSAGAKSDYINKLMEQNADKVIKNRISDEILEFGLRRGRGYGCRERGYHTGELNIPYSDIRARKAQHVFGVEHYPHRHTLPYPMLIEVLVDRGGINRKVKMICHPTEVHGKRKGKKGFISKTISNPFFGETGCGIHVLIDEREFEWHGEGCA